ncbi:MAG: hypothetical protein ACRENS_10935 [Candidatus Eiseniibacteriota bacterium]
MRPPHFAVALLCVALLSASAAHAAPADIPLLGFTGYDYHVASPASTHYLDAGDQYFSLGFVTSFDPALLGSHVDSSVNEYTFLLDGLAVQATFYSGGLLEADFVSAPSSRARFYEDALATGTHADYGASPENATAPATFIDGQVVLGGQISSFVVTYNFGVDQGTFSGSINFDEGSDLAFIPVSQRGGWAFGGIAGNPLVPQGYDHQVNGQCQVPSSTPVAHVTWGAIKSLYRR